MHTYMHAYTYTYTCAYMYMYTSKKKMAGWTTTCHIRVVRTHMRQAGGQGR